MKTGEKLAQITEDLKVLTATTISMMDQTNNSKLSPAQKDALGNGETVLCVEHL